MSILTKVQLQALQIVADGGKIFLFEDGSVGLDDKYGNTLKFIYPTFRALNKKGCIAIKIRPSLGVEVYGITLIGYNHLKQITP